MVFKEKNTTVMVKVVYWGFTKGITYWNGGFIKYKITDLEKVLSSERNAYKDFKLIRVNYLHFENTIVAL